MRTEKRNKVLTILTSTICALLAFLCLFSAFNTKSAESVSADNDVEYIGYVYAINNWYNGNGVVNYLNFNTYEEFDFNETYDVYLYDTVKQEINYDFVLYHANYYTVSRTETDNTTKENLATFALALVDEENNIYYIQSFEDHCYDLGFEDGCKKLESGVANFFNDYGWWILTGVIVIALGIGLIILAKK